MSKERGSESYVHYPYGCNITSTVIIKINGIGVYEKNIFIRPLTQGTMMSSYWTNKICTKTLPMKHGLDGDY